MKLEHGKKYICEIKALYGNGSYQEVLTYDENFGGFFNNGAFFTPFMTSVPKQTRLTVLRKADSTPRELVKYIQGNFGCGWEDVSSYPMGYRRKNEKEQTELLKHDLKEYRLSGQGVYRVVARYEEI